MSLPSLPLAIGGGDVLTIAPSTASGIGDYYGRAETEEPRRPVSGMTAAGRKRSVLEHRQDVACRVAEPGLLRAWVRDALLVRGDRAFVVVLELHAGGVHAVDGRLDVVD